MNVLFKDFAAVVNKQMMEMSQGQLYIVDINGYALGEKYLDFIPVEHNPKHRERRVYDCTTCLKFIRNVGNVVAIKNGELVSIWDVEIGGYYQEVADKMSAYIKEQVIHNVYVTDEPISGLLSNLEPASERSKLPMEWFHFNFVAPQAFVHSAPDAIRGEFKTQSQTLERALEELTLEAGKTVLELMLDNNLERGPQYQQIVTDFVTLKRMWDQLETDLEKNIFIWKNVTSHVCRIRNEAIGTLLIDLSGKVVKITNDDYVAEDTDLVIGEYARKEPLDLENAVNAYEHKVSGENFKRPKGIYTEAMTKAAMDSLKEYGIRDNIDRRHAVFKDVSTNDVLWSDAKLAHEIKDPLEAVLMADTKPAKNVSQKATDININNFIGMVLPNAVSIQALLENTHANNLMSIIAPKHVNGNHLFKWDNEYSWTYRGDVADTIKQRVIEAGGSTQGVARFSLIWDNIDDLDLHILEPGGHVYHQCRESFTSGTLDVDKNVQGSELTSKPVENIIYSNLDRMPDGDYRVIVQNYQARDPHAENFKLQAVINGVTTTYTYKGRMENKAELLVLTMVKNGKDLSFKDISNMVTSAEDPYDIWGLRTQKYVPVSSVMLSPNYWHEQQIENKHFMFILDGCLNPAPARGIYNEYLRPELHADRQVFEVIGSKTKCEYSDDQLSGLGFPSTKDGQLVCKVTDRENKTITYKINIK